MRQLGAKLKQRDEHIRRYAELLEAQAKIPEPQTAAPEIGYKKPPPAKKGIARQIADATGLSDDTVRRALNPKPPAEVVPISGVMLSCWRNSGKPSRDRVFKLNTL